MPTWEEELLLLPTLPLNPGVDGPGPIGDLRWPPLAILCNGRPLCAAAAAALAVSAAVDTSATVGAVANSVFSWLTKLMCIFMSVPRTRLMTISRNRSRTLRIEREKREGEKKTSSECE